MQEAWLKHCDLWQEQLFPFYQSKKKRIIGNQRDSSKSSGVFFLLLSAPKKTVHSLRRDSEAKVEEP